MLSKATFFLLLSFGVIGCAPRIQEVQELDLTFFEHSSQFSNDSVIKYLEKRSLIYKADSEVPRWPFYKFEPVFICGIPCSIYFGGNPKIKFFESFEIFSSFEYLEKYKNVKEEDNPYSVSGLDSKKALQDSLISRMKAKYGDWDHWIKEDSSHSVRDPSVKLHTIGILTPGEFPANHNDTSTIVTLIMLQDSAYFATHALK